MIFSFLPSLRAYYAYKGKGGQNYVYLNTKKISNSKYVTGLGFGGNKEYKEFRIWLDDDIMEKSYTFPFDETYPQGALSGGYEERLNVECIEAWGLGGEDDLEKQEEYRQMRQTMTQNARKVDKKKFLQGEFANQAFEKTFAHREQIEGDLDHMKAEAQFDKK